jgi:hypothetical protein
MTIDLKNQNQSVKIAIFVAVVLIITLAAFFFVRSRTSESQNATKELEDIVSELSKTIDLPEEVPTIATVTDKNLLSEQEFFSRAENGDKVVIFQVWRKAILYRPSSKKIIDLTNISANQGPDLTGSATQPNPTTTPQAQPVATPTPVPTNYRVALYNGSTTAGLAQTASNQLRSQPSVSIVAQQNAARNNYTQTLVIPIQETSRNMASNLAGILSGSISSLPEGETLPANTDILIILGAPTTPQGAATPSAQPN